jgi:hypothetical protein
MEEGLPIETGVTDTEVATKIIVSGKHGNAGMVATEHGPNGAAKTKNLKKHKTYKSFKYLLLLNK